MKVYQVRFNNGECYVDGAEYAGSLYTTREEAEKEILHDNYMIKNDYNERVEYTVNQIEWARLMNRDNCTNEYKPYDCDDHSFAYIEEITLLEVFTPEEDEDE